MNLICYRKEIELEKERLRSAADDARNANKRAELLDRLNYFEDYTWTISEFAEHVKKRFA